jgi:hypothetical protein
MRMVVKVSGLMSYTNETLGYSYQQASVQMVGKERVVGDRRLFDRLLIALKHGANTLDEQLIQS